MPVKQCTGSCRSVSAETRNCIQYTQLLAFRTASTETRNCIQYTQFCYSEMNFKVLMISGANIIALILGGILLVVMGSSVIVSMIILLAILAFCPEAVREKTPTRMEKISDRIPGARHHTTPPNCPPHPGTAGMSNHHEQHRPGSRVPQPKLPLSGRKLQ